ncbi:MAG: M23 family metallopeptidase [Defluviitaleaceae bacterium]|nr:M23 family metallopeptidase [Defluviitaleaceae bacterium]
MRKIKGFLINHTYSAYRAYVSAGIVLVLNFLNNRVFDVPSLVWRVFNVIFWLLMTHSFFYPLVLNFFPTLYMFIRNGFKLPAKDNYTNKSDYILPFTGKWTVGNGGFKRGEYHSGGFLGSERNAFDFNIMEDEDGVPDDWTLPSKVEEYPCYGKDVIAVADGVVVKVRNHHPDSRTKNLKAYCDTYDYKGNHIIIKHNDSEYSLTVHLMPYSITVKKGDKVKQGQIIARCGNSGNCAAPHIHFALQSGKSRLFAYALPIAFTNIKAEDSPAHRAFCEALGRKPAKAGENIAVAGNKTYIGRGLDVENKVD